MQSLTLCFTYPYLVAGLLDALNTSDFNHHISSTDNTVSCPQNATPTNSGRLVERVNDIHIVNQCPPQLCKEDEMNTNATEFVESHRANDTQQFSSPFTPRDWILTCKSPVSNTDKGQFYTVRGECWDNQICFNGYNAQRALCVPRAKNFQLVVDPKTAVRRQRMYAPSMTKGYKYVEVFLIQWSGLPVPSGPPDLYEARYTVLEAENSRGGELVTPSMGHRTSNLRLQFAVKMDFHVDVTVAMNSLGDQANIHVFFGY